MLDGKGTKRVMSRSWTHSPTSASKRSRGSMASSLFLRRWLIIISYPQELPRGSHLKMKYPGNPVPCAVYSEQQNSATGCVLLLCPTSRTRLCCPLQTRLDRIMQASSRTNIYLSIWTNTFGNLDKYIWQFGPL